MTKALKQALSEVERLPEADQETIGRQVPTHVEKLHLVRSDIDRGIRSLEAGKGQQLEIDDVIAVAGTALVKWTRDQDANNELHVVA